MIRITFQIIWEYIFVFVYFTLFWNLERRLLYISPSLSLSLSLSLSQERNLNNPYFWDTCRIRIASSINDISKYVFPIIHFKEQFKVNYIIHISRFHSFCWSFIAQKMKAILWQRIAGEVERAAFNCNDTLQAKRFPA